MLRKIAIGLAVATLFGAASIPTDALAAMRGGVGHGGFGGGGFGRSFAAPRAIGAPNAFAGRGFVGRGFAPGFRHHRFARFGAPLIGLGLGLGALGAYSYYDDCYVWTPYGYRWACGYDYY
jgi:hypothetical protein